AAHQAVVDKDDALAIDLVTVRGVLQAHAELADALRRLDEGAADIMVADDAELEGVSAFLRITQSGRHARIRDRHDHVRIDGALARKFLAHALADLVSALALDDGVRAGEIDVFENARTHALRGKRLVRFQNLLAAFLTDNDHLAVVDVAYVFRADRVERAGFGSEDVFAVELTENERPDA